MAASIWENEGLPIAASGVMRSQRFVAIAGQTVFNLTDFAYTPNSDSLLVFVNGVAQSKLVDFVETSGTVLTLVTGAEAGDIVLLVGASVAGVQDGTDPVLRADLASSAGAGIVGIADVGGLYTGATVETALQEAATFIPAGAGAVATTVQAKLRESVSVKDFGAVGDGVTDDTTEVQAAIAASTGSTVVLPAGGVFLCGPLTVSADVVLKIDGTLKMKDSTGTLLTFDSSSSGRLTGTGIVDLNGTQFTGITINGVTDANISGSLLITNMLGGAASTGNSGAINVINCTSPKISGVKITQILHGTAPADSQPRAITLDTCTNAVVDFVADAINSGCVVAACTDTVVKANIVGGSVTNDNAFYVISSADTTITADIFDWDGEPIVSASSTNTVVLNGSQIDCVGNSNGFENSTGLTFINTVFKGNNFAGVLKSRTANTTSTNVAMIGCTIDVSSTQEVISFFNGTTNDVKLLGNTIVVTHDTSKTFGSKFIRLQSTDSFVIDNNVIIFKEIAAAAAADFTIDLNCSAYSSFFDNRLINRTASGRFRVNGVTANVAIRSLHKQANIDGFRNANYLLGTAEPKLNYGSSIPTAGVHNAGDIVLNTAPTAGGTIGWVCTTAGTPGTWKTWGAVSA